MLRTDVRVHVRCFPPRKDNVLWRWNWSHHPSRDCNCRSGFGRTVSQPKLTSLSDFFNRFMCAAHQGTRAGHPCPKCLVKNQDQSNLMVLTIARSHQSSKQIIVAARDFLRDKQKSQSVALLQKVSLYLVNVRPLHYLCRHFADLTLERMVVPWSHWCAQGALLRRSPHHMAWPVGCSSPSIVDESVGTNRWRFY